MIRILFCILMLRTFWAKPKKWQELPSRYCVHRLGSKAKKAKQLAFFYAFHPCTPLKLPASSGFGRNLTSSPLLKKMRKVSYTLPIALFLSGCGSTENTLPYPLTITQEGMGPIHPGETFDSSRIQSTLPGFTIEAVSQISPQKAPMILILKRGDNPIAFLLPEPDGKHIGQITVLSPLIKDKHNQSVGDPIKMTSDFACRGDECHYSHTPALLYKLEADRTIREITVQKL